MLSQPEQGPVLRHPDDPLGHIRIDRDRPGDGQFEIRHNRCHQPCAHLLHRRAEVAFGLVQEVLMLLRVFSLPDIFVMRYHL